MKPAGERSEPAGSAPSPMPRDDDHFWLAIFRKSPLIGFCMAVSGVVGAFMGGYHFFELLRALRVYLCVLTCCFAAGAAVGLVIGVLADSVIRSFRGDNDRKKKRWPPDRSL